MMILPSPKTKPLRRRAAGLMLAVLCLPVVVTVVAASLRLGSVHLVRTELQVAADAAAMDAAALPNRGFDEIAHSARRRASLHRAAGRGVRLAVGDVELGVWDMRFRRFKTSLDGGNAIRVTTRYAGRDRWWPLAEVHTRSVAWAVPRDIALVVDLSGAMNDGTLSGGAECIQRLYDDFGFGDYPGDTENQGKPASQKTNAVVDSRIARLMPRAILSADSVTDDDYWQAYLDYLAHPDRAVGASHKPGNTSAEDTHNKIGYRSYVRFMLDHGRDRQPVPGRYVPLSRHAQGCPWHAESTAAGTFRFPPRTQPMHSVRRTLITTIQRIEASSAGAAHRDQADWVSVITYDSLSGGGPLVVQPLGPDYSAASRACARLQAVGKQAADSATEAGLIAAYRHLQPPAAGGRGRPFADKIVVLITATAPNAYQSDLSEIRRGMGEYPHVGFDPDGRPAHDAALLQAAKLRRHGWQLHVIGVGHCVDREFLDRLALAADRETDPAEPRSRHLADTLDKIVESRHALIVQ